MSKPIIGVAVLYFIMAMVVWGFYQTDTATRDQAKTIASNAEQFHKEVLVDCHNQQHYRSAIARTDSYRADNDRALAAAFGSYPAIAKLFKERANQEGRIAGDVTAALAAVCGQQFVKMKVIDK